MTRPLKSQKKENKEKYQYRPILEMVTGLCFRISSAWIKFHGDTALYAHTPCLKHFKNYFWSHWNGVTFEPSGPKAKESREIIMKQTYLFPVWQKNLIQTQIAWRSMNKMCICEIWVSRKEAHKRQEVLFTSSSPSLLARRPTYEPPGFPSPSLLLSSQQRL